MQVPVYNYLHTKQISKSTEVHQYLMYIHTLAHNKAKVHYNWSCQKYKVCYTYYMYLYTYIPEGEEELTVVFLWLYEPIAVL